MQNKEKEKSANARNEHVIPNVQHSNLPAYLTPFAQAVYGIDEDESCNELLYEVEEQYKMFFPPFMRDDAKEKDKSKGKHKNASRKDGDTTRDAGLLDKAVAKDTQVNKLSKDTIGVLSKQADDTQPAKKKTKKKKKSKKKAHEAILDAMMQEALNAR